MVKKLVTITVEAVVEIEMGDWAAQPTSEDIESVNACGYSVDNSDDIFKQAAIAVFQNGAGGNLDVYGRLVDSVHRDSVERPDLCTFFDIRSIYASDFEVNNAD